MADREILSQDEMDALAEGVSQGAIAIGADKKPIGEVRPYDFHQPAHLLKARLPSLEKINERISGLFQKSLFGLLQKYIEITSSEVELIKQGDYLAKQPVNVSINRIKLSELNGTMTFVMDSKLVFMIVESFFGGNEPVTQATDREYTTIEKRVIERVVKMAVECMAPAWRPILKLSFEYRPEETRFAMNGSASSSDVLAVSKFTVKIDSEEGTFDIVIPYAILEPIRTLLASGLQNSPVGKDESWGIKLLDRIKYSNVELNSVFAETEITFKELLSLQAGDFIPIDMREMAKVYAGDTPLFEGKIGVSNNMIAIKHTAWCKQD